MKIELTTRQKRLLRIIDDVCSYASSGCRLKSISLTKSQFATFKSIVKKKKIFPEAHQKLQIEDNQYRGFDIRQARQHEPKMVFDNQSLFGEETNGTRSQ